MKFSEIECSAVLNSAQEFREYKVHCNSFEEDLTWCQVGVVWNEMKYSMASHSWYLAREEDPAKWCEMKLVRYLQSLWLKIQNSPNSSASQKNSTWDETLGHHRRIHDIWLVRKIWRSGARQMQDQGGSDSTDGDNADTLPPYFSSTNNCITALFQLFQLYVPPYFKQTMLFHKQLYPIIVFHHIPSHKIVCHAPKETIPFKNGQVFTAKLNVTHFPTLHNNNFVEL